MGERQAQLDGAAVDRLAQASTSSARRRQSRPLTSSVANSMAALVGLPQALREDAQQHGGDGRMGGEVGRNPSPRTSSTVAGSSVVRVAERSPPSSPANSPTISPWPTTVSTTSRPSTPTLVTLARPSSMMTTLSDGSPSQKMAVPAR